MTSLFRNKKSQGFGAVLMMTLLPVGLGLMFAVHFALAFIQFELRQNHSCRTTLIPVQNKVGIWLEQLLDLNPQAIKLRAAELQAQIELAAALTTGNPLTIAKATQKLQSIRNQRTILDQKQKQLIRASNLLLYQGHLQAKSILLRDQKEFLPSLKPFLSSQYRLEPGTPPTLAVRPDIPDTAPVYILKNDFEAQQALVQKWQYNFHVQSVLKTFAQGPFKFEKDCAVTLQKRNFQWIAKIQKVKSSPKSLW